MGVSFREFQDALDTVLSFPCVAGMCGVCRMGCWWVSVRQRVCVGTYTSTVTESVVCRNCTCCLDAIEM